MFPRLNGGSDVRWYQHIQRENKGSDFPGSSPPLRPPADRVQFADKRFGIGNVKEAHLGGPRSEKVHTCVLVGIRPLPLSKEDGYVPAVPGALERVGVPSRGMS